MSAENKTHIDQIKEQYRTISEANLEKEKEKALASVHRRIENRSNSGESWAGMHLENEIAKYLREVLREEGYFVKTDVSNHHFDKLFLEVSWADKNPFWQYGNILNKILDFIMSILRSFHK